MTQESRKTDLPLLKVDTPTSSLPVAETGRLGPLGAAYLTRLCCRILASSRARHVANQIVCSPFGLPFLVLSGLLLPHFLHAAKSARIHRIAHPGVNTIPEQTLSLCPLGELGFIRVEGTDAEDFLHGQLSQQIEGLGPDRAPLAAWHSAAGRVKAIFRVLRLDEDWLLVTGNELAGAVTADLRRYVLNADVTLGDDGDRWRAAALIGDTDRWLDRHDIGLGHDSGQRVSAKGSDWLRIGPQLVHVIGSAAATKELEAGLPHGTSGEAALAEISLGLPRLTLELQDRFIPQMLNLDLLSALDENKGCYPGQEIIARAQHLGSVKRRMIRFSADLTREPAIGTAILNESGAAVGDVVRSSEAADKFEILAVTRLDCLDQQLVTEAEPSVPLRREALPYLEM